MINQEYGGRVISNISLGQIVTQMAVVVATILLHHLLPLLLLRQTATPLIHQPAVAVVAVAAAHLTPFAMLLKAEAVQLHVDKHNDDYVVMVQYHHHHW